MYTVDTISQIIIYYKKDDVEDVTTQYYLFTVYRLYSHKV